MRQCGRAVMDGLQKGPGRCGVKHPELVYVVAVAPVERCHAFFVVVVT